MKKLKNQTVTTSVNQKTGELTEVTVEKSYTIKNVNVDNFYMTFIENMSGYFHLKSAIEIKVLTKFCCIAEFNTGTVLLPQQIREEMCELISISSQQLTNAIRSLKNKGFLNGDKGVFTINPKVFWKGTTQEREKLMKNGTITFNVSIE